MNASVIVEMDGKKTRIHKPKQNAIDMSNASVALAARESFHDFTFDHSYWSFEGGKSHEHVVTQEEVYSDLGMDVINSAFQGAIPRARNSIRRRRTCCMRLAVLHLHGLFPRQYLTNHLENGILFSRLRLQRLRVCLRPNGKRQDVHDDGLAGRARADPEDLQRDVQPHEAGAEVRHRIQDASQLSRDLQRAR